MTIKLNEFDRKLLSNIKSSDTWQKLKNIYTINGEIKRLKIGNNKIGTKCAKHLQKLATKHTVTLNEIKDGCKDLIPKKHKHGLAKDKTKRDKETTHTKIDVSQNKPPPPKVKKPPKPRQPSATQQLVNLLTAQQTMQRQQTIQRQIQDVDRILTDRVKTPELPQQIQRPDLQLRTQSLGSQVQDNSQKSRLQLLEGSLLDREKGLTAMQRSLERQKIMAKDKLDNASLLESVVEDNERKQRVGNQVSNYVNKERNRYKQLVMDGRMTHSQAQQNIQNLNNKYINHLQNRESQELQSKNILQDIEELERYKQFTNQPAIQSVTKQLQNKEANNRQKQLLSDIVEIGKKQRAERIENTLGNLQIGVMGRTSGIAEQQTIFDRNRLNLKQSVSLEDVSMTDEEQQLALGIPPSKSARADLPAGAQKKIEEQLKGEAIFNRKVREKTRVSRRKKRKALKDKGDELKELQLQYAEPVQQQLVYGAKPTSVNPVEQKIEPEVSMEEKPSPRKALPAIILPEILPEDKKVLRGNYHIYESAVVQHNNLTSKQSRDNIRMLRRSEAINKNDAARVFRDNATDISRKYLLKNVLREYSETHDKHPEINQFRKRQLKAYGMGVLAKLDENPPEDKGGGFDNLKENYIWNDGDEESVNRMFKIDKHYDNKYSNLFDEYEEIYGRPPKKNLFE